MATNWDYENQKPWYQKISEGLTGYYGLKEPSFEPIPRRELTAPVAGAMDPTVPKSWAPIPGSPGAIERTTPKPTLPQQPTRVNQRTVQPNVLPMNADKTTADPFGNFMSAYEKTNPREAGLAKQNPAFFTAHSKDIYNAGGDISKLGHVTDRWNQWVNQPSGSEIGIRGAAAPSVAGRQSRQNVLPVQGGPQTEAPIDWASLTAKDWGEMKRTQTPDPLKAIADYVDMIAPAYVQGGVGVRPELRMKLFNDLANQYLGYVGGNERQQIAGEYDLRKADVVGQYGLEGHRISAGPQYANVGMRGKELALATQKQQFDQEHSGDTARMAKELGILHPYIKQLTESDPEAANRFVAPIAQKYGLGGVPQVSAAPRTPAEAYQILKQVNPNASDKDIQSKIKSMKFSQ